MARLVMVVVALGISACAALQGKPDDVVAERAQARWNDLVKGDFKAAYQYLSPGSKTLQSEQDYVSSLKRDFWKSAKLDSVECEENRCEVHLTIEYEFRGHRIKSLLQETWVKDGREWWYLLR